MPIDFSLTALEYILDDEKLPVAHFFGRDADWVRVHVHDNSFIPYFLVRKTDSDFLPMSKYIREVGPVEKVHGLGGVPVRKVTVMKPADVKTMRNYLTKKKRKSVMFSMKRGSIPNLDLLYDVNIETTFQGDLLFPLVIMLDNDIYTGMRLCDDGYLQVLLDPQPSRYVIHFLDIELFSKVIQRAENPRDPVNVLGFYDTLKKSFYILHTCPVPLNIDIDKVIMSKPKKLEFIPFKREEDLLQHWVDMVEELDPDIIVTFSPFDMPMLLGRMRHHHIDASRLSPLRDVRVRRRNQVYIAGRYVLDQQELHQKVFLKELKWRTLDYIATKQAKLGYGQIVVPDYYDTWLEQPELIISRNIRDVELCREIDKKENLIVHFDELRRIAGCRLTDALIHSRFATMMYLRFCKGKVYLPTRSPHWKIKYKGAKVWKAILGVYDWVTVFDFRSMYPSIMEAFNISFETFDPHYGDLVIDEEHKFSSKETGITVLLLRMLRAKRKEVRSAAKELQALGKSVEAEILELRQEAYKSSVNMIYGQFGNAGRGRQGIPAFSLYHPKVAESITLGGRILIIGVDVVILPPLGLKLIYGDTDSGFVPKVNVEYAHEILPKIQEGLRKFLKDKWNYEGEAIEIGIDKVYKKMALITPKRYFGHLVYKNGPRDEIEYKGLERVRADCPELTFNLQTDLAELTVRYEGEDGVQLMKDLVRSAIEDLLADKIPWKEWALPKRLTKPTEQYKVRSEHLKAVLYTNEHLKLGIVPGERFFMVHVTEVPEGYPDTETIVFREQEDIPEGFIFDYLRIVFRTIQSPCEDILAINGIKWEEVEPSTLRILKETTITKKKKKVKKRTKKPSPKKEVTKGILDKKFWDSSFEGVN